MKNTTLSRRRALALASGILASPMVAPRIARAADDWPSKPVRYINSFPAGGPTDVLSRIACQELGKLTGQQFIVENKGGSGGNIGAEAIARATPDGYTIGLYSVASHAIASGSVTSSGFRSTPARQATSGTPAGSGAGPVTSHESRGSPPISTGPPAVRQE